LAAEKIAQTPFYSGQAGDRRFRPDPVVPE